ncbi:MAG TPA: winged helix-turn-helix domain-containing protein [Mycobacteriales bacterium]|nr:winged helix-turn-helix domain-containing protein [Mycobacteriales bacterium]
MPFGSREAPALRDPRAIRALAHPARLAILERLASGGPATATECAEVTGQSPSACSYHLRALAKWGLVDESEGLDRRERRWAVRGPFVIGDHDGPRRADVAAAEHVLTAQVLDRATARALAWLDGSDDEPREWRDAAVIGTRALRLTPQELTALLQDVDRLCAPYAARARGDVDAGDARLVHLHLSAVPGRS